MQIHITRSDAPSAPKEIIAELSAMSPRVFMQWNPVTYKVNDLNGVHFQGRWEIWCELMDSSHPDARNLQYKTDRWNTDAQCLMRKLMTYQTEGGDFAPIDRGLIIGLNMADTWANRLFYEDEVEKPYEAWEAKQISKQVQAASGGASHYRNYNNPTVGGHRGGSRAGWRHRIR